MNKLSVDFVEEAIRALYRASDKPRADLVQEVLDGIESIPNEKVRSILFTTAKQHLQSDLKELVVSSRARANRAWGSIDTGAGTPHKRTE
jgi:hypothetical protein